MTGGGTHPEITPHLKAWINTELLASCAKCTGVICFLRFSKMFIRYGHGGISAVENIAANSTKIQADSVYNGWQYQKSLHQRQKQNGKADNKFLSL